MIIEDFKAPSLTQVSHKLATQQHWHQRYGFKTARRRADLQSYHQDFLRDKLYELFIVKRKQQNLCFKRGQEKYYTTKSDQKAK